MATTAPPVDPRTAVDIAKQVRDLLASYVPAWREQYTDPATDQTRNDQPGTALIGIFSRFAEIIIQRLNQAPEKNFLAFLDLLGASQRPPLPARVPLTFALAAGSLGDVMAPAGTQVAASAAEGETTPVLFETEADLVLTATQLKAVFVRDPEGDKYADRTAQATGIKDESFDLFKGTLPSEHSLYLACDELFTLPAPKTLTITISLESGSTWPAVTWNYSDGKKWKSLSCSSPSQNPVSFSDPPASIKTTIDSMEAAWLKAQLKSPPPVQDKLPTIITINVTAKRTSLLPDLGFVNTRPLDLTKDFYPFGENPQLNDTFYLASQEVFSKAGATVEMTVTLNPGAPIKKDGRIVVVWEAWNGSAWEKLYTDDQKTQVLSFAFTTTQTISFKLPGQMGPHEENGATSYWIRARITQGNYGAGSSSQPPIFTTLSQLSPLGSSSLTINLARGIMPGDDIYIPAKGAANEFHTAVQSLSFNASKIVLTLKDALTSAQNENTSVWIYPKVDLAPPLVKSLTLAYNASRPLSACKSCNDLTFENWANFKEPFQPFKRSPDKEPTLYLGFDRPFTANRPISLYVQSALLLYQAAAVKQPSTIESGQDQSTKQSPIRLVWEYYAGQDAWKKLVVQDETHSFTKRGLISFMAPSDLQSCQQFGQALYWLRVRHEAGTFSHPPRARRLLANTTWAKQAVTITDEVLGSGNGGKNQRFQTTQTPVLTRQQLQVRELEEPSAAERVRITEEEGESAIPRPDAAGCWVRWHEVPDFYGSGPRDRHYVINHMTGELTFGDGVSGLIPPIGQGNVRMARYQTGGGKAGNKPVGSLVQLKTTIPYVESVTNWEAAGGGAEADSLDDVKKLMPRSIRHGNRAVTVEDFEDLAMLASPAVARAKCVPLYDLHNDDPNTNKPGAISVIIVPRTTDDRPVPSLELLDQVERYLNGHRIPTADLAVVGPKAIPEK